MKRSRAKAIQPPSGTKATAPAQTQHRVALATTTTLRPKRSAIQPKVGAPIMAPTPALSSITVVWPKVSFHSGATAETR